MAEELLSPELLESLGGDNAVMLPPRKKKTKKRRVSEEVRKEAQQLSKTQMKKLEKLKVTSICFCVIILFPPIPAMSLIL